MSFYSCLLFPNLENALEVHVRKYMSYMYNAEDDTTSSVKNRKNFGFTTAVIHKVICFKNSSKYYIFKMNYSSMS